MSAIPIAGDITGLAADAAMYSAYPEERTMGNYAMSALGVLPLVPGAAALRAARGESKTATNAINVQGIDIPIRKPSDNINNVMQANFNYPNIIGNQTLNINDIYGGVRADPNERRRVDDLSAKISGEGGFISRIIVDQDNNVVEGQHRLEALRQLGASEVPVYKIEDLSSTLPVLEMENAINNSGKIHPDNVNQIMQYALENIAEHGIDGARDFDFGNYQKYYDAALRAARGTTSPLEGTLDMSTDARMQRAAEQGYLPETVYHGTAADINTFDPSAYGGSVTKARSAKMGTWFSDNPDVSATYARYAAESVPVQNLIDQSNRAGRARNFDLQEKLMLEAENLELSGELIGGGGQNVVPSRIKGNMMEVDAGGATMSDLDESQLYQWATDAKNKGFDGLKINNFSDNADYGVYMPATHYLVFDPSGIRSVNAAFDPAMRGSANLLAGTAGATIGLSALRNIQREDEQSRID
jgi:hypothetical protein